MSKYASASFAAGWKPVITIQCRAARIADSREIAQLACVAGLGLYEFLFDDLIPLMKAADFLAAGVASEDSPISYRNCCVATVRDTIVGSANVFPTDALKNEDYAVVPSDRIDHIRSMLELQDWGSMFLNSLAVSEAHRGAGIGIRLLGWARTRAREAGFDRLSLHVWADNTSALRFYEAHGFVRQGIATVPTHPRLPRKGGSILMRQIISGEDAS